MPALITNVGPMVSKPPTPFRAAEVLGRSGTSSASANPRPTAYAELYVRKTGSDSNGGSSNGTSPDRTGTDGVTNGTTTFTSASANFTSADVNKLINIVTRGRYRIVGFTNSTTVTLSGSPATGSGFTWNIGGAVLTIGALLANANAAVVGGDRIWIGAGTYREQIAVGITPTVEVLVQGDVDGLYTGDPGMVRWTCVSDDKNALAGTNLAFGSKSFFTIKRIVFDGYGTFSIITASGATDIKILDCSFIMNAGPQAVPIAATALFGQSLNWLIDRCRFLSSTNTNVSGIAFTCTTGIGADYDINCVVQNSAFISGGINISAISVTNSGTLANKGNGVRLRNCLVIGRAMGTTATQVSTTIPSYITNCIIYGGNGTGISSGTSGQIIEDYNIIQAGTPRTNTAIGPHSVVTYITNFHYGQESIWQGALRQFGEPMIGSPQLAFGNDGNQSWYDEGNNPRPAGGVSSLPAVGALDRANTFAKETSTVHTGSNAISTTGPAYQDFLVPVDSGLQTLSMYLRYDSTYAGTRPQLLIINGTECGVFDAIGVFGDANSDADPGPNAWGKIAIPISPTNAGIVTLRVLSNDTNGVGKCIADSFSVS